MEQPKKDLNKVSELTNSSFQIHYKNESERLKKEMGILFDQNRDLYNLIQDCGFFCKKEFNKDIVITMISRTDVEQAEIYKDDPKYKAKPFKSPHQFYHAVDLRSSTFDTHEIEKLVNYINTKYNKTNEYKWTAKNHDIGLGEHFHIQYVKKV